MKHLLFFRLAVLGMVAVLVLANYTSVAPAFDLLEPPSDCARRAERVPVLLYHNLGETTVPGGNGATVPVAEFASQMRYLHEHGYHTITAGELHDCIAGAGRLPVRPVLITFDDGYGSIFTHAFPILKAYGLKATVFIVASSVGQTLAADLPHLTWEELRLLQENGVEIQSHTFDGHRLNGETAILQQWTPDEIQADAGRVRAAMAEHGLAAPIAFAFPFGQYNEESLKAIAQIYQIAFSITPRTDGVGDPSFRLKRLIIWPETTEDLFAQMLRGESIPT